MTTTFTANTFPDTDGIYLGIAKNVTSYAAHFTNDEIRQLQKVLDDALNNQIRR